MAVLCFVISAEEAVLVADSILNHIVKYCYNYQLNGICVQYFPAIIPIKLISAIVDETDKSISFFVAFLS